MRWAREAPTAIAIVDGAHDSVDRIDVTFARLDAEARAIGCYLDGAGMAGQRVLIMLPQGWRYACFLLGCLYAGAVAVPAYPLGGRLGSRFDRIAEDCRPALAITTADRESACRRRVPNDCQVIAEHLATAHAGTWVPVTPEPEGLAYLQYTSGSTSDPRGVMVTHDNLTQQLRLLQGMIPRDRTDVFVSWLPMFHDFGLVCGLLYPLWAGAKLVLLSPQDFVQEPALWLRELSFHRATTTFAPNFALQLACDRIPHADQAGFDLSALTILGSGAEPIRPDTLHRFARTFEQSRFSEAAFTPGYGMAETTLSLTSKPMGRPPTIVQFDVQALEAGRLVRAIEGRPSRWLVSNGTTVLDTRVLVVDVQTSAELPDGMQGELWASGRTVAGGYWGQRERSAETFGATSADGRGPFLRTGDLGAWFEGELFVTGRCKDVMIFRGRNIYPQDIEFTVSHAHRGLAPERAAAFAVGDEPALVVLAELDRNRRHDADLTEVTSAIVAAITREHDVAPQAVVLLQPAALPVTSSGKVRRHECRERYLDGSHRFAHSWERPTLPAERQPGPEQTDGDSLHGAGRLVTREQLISWLRQRLAELTGLSRAAVGTNDTFFSYGLDSARLMALNGELTEFLGRSTAATLWYDHPTVDALARAVIPDERPSIARAEHNRIDEPDRSEQLQVAVAGMACRFPGAADVDAFWELLVNGRDAIVDVPTTREPGFRVAPGERHPAATQWGGFIDGIDLFDAGFFGLSRAEAESMDPQQRLLLTSVWRALENAGLPPDTLRGSRTGVFVGISSSDYRTLQARAGGGVDAYSGTGNALSVAANRISYTLDLRGPSLAIDTACSSSLTALHEAVAQLRSGACDLAIVGGVNVILDPGVSSIFANAGMLAADGHCKTFDALADGYVRGEGCGVLILQRFSDVVERQGIAHALVRGTAVNQDGRSNSLTAPNGLAQQAVIRSALAAAGISAGEVTCVEAHGTGTKLGDPIEMNALQMVYGAPAESGPVWIGSVKTNIGHLEAAAGMAGLIKAILCIERAMVVPHLHLDTLNPLIELAGTRVRIPDRSQEWAPDGSRIAAVSSFGFGGTNAHCILEQIADDPRGPAPQVDDDRWQLLPVSAKNAGALAELRRGYAELLTSTGAPRLAAVAQAAANNRAHQGHRCAVIARGAADAADLLRVGGDRLVSGVQRTEDLAAALVFTGQGAQYPGMARALYLRHQLFRTVVNDVDDMVRSSLGISLLPTLCGLDGDIVDLEQTVYAQPALFTVGYALGRVWLASGVRPSAVMGHSLGEFIAMATAGMLDLPDAVRLVCARASFMQDNAAPGAMYALAATPDALAQVRSEISSAGFGDLSVAAENSPEQLVVSGPIDALAAAVQRWRSRGITASKLRGTRAFHSTMMLDAAERLRKFAVGITVHQPEYPVIANVTGEIADAGGVTEEYWYRQALRPVQFHRSLQTLADSGCGTFVECGPHPALAPLGEAAMPSSLWISSLHRSDQDDAGFLTSVGRWYVSGGAVDWRAGQRARDGLAVSRQQPAVALPGHPLRAERYWFADASARPVQGHALLGRRLDVAGADGHWFTQTLRGDADHVADHVVRGQRVLPAAATVEWVLAAARSAPDGPRIPEAWRVGDLELLAPVVVGAGSPVELQARVSQQSGEPAVSCFSRPSGGRAEWTECARAGRVVAFQARPQAVLDLDGWPAGLPERDVDAHYTRLRASGLEYGPRFRALRRLFSDGQIAVGEVQVGHQDRDLLVDPVVLDAAFHATAALIPDASGLWLPSFIDEIVVHRALPDHVWCRARRLDDGDPAELKFDIDLRAPDGTAVLSISGLRLRRAELSAAIDPAPGPTDYTMDWRILDIHQPAAAAPKGWVILGQDPAQINHWREQLSDLPVAPPAQAAIVQIADELSAEPLGTPVAAQSLAWRAFEMVRRLRRESGARPPRIVICTTGALTVPAAEHHANSLESSVLTGLTRAAISEGIDCVQVDVDPADPTGTSLAEIVDRVTAEAGGGHLAIRSGRWYRAELRAETGQGEGSRPCPVRPNSTYLITGGTGGLGIATAQWLASRGAQHLVLAGRGNRTRELVEVNQLRRRGVEVRVVAVDVANPGEVQSLLTAIRDELPPLRGVIHAAGVTVDGAFDTLSHKDFESVLAPKVNGAWHLHTATRGCELDFFVMYSSMASLAGSAGQANYVVANAFLDALAQRRRDEKLPGLSVNWAPWSEIGMGAAAGLSATFARQGIHRISPTDALARLDRPCAAHQASIGFADVDWSAHGEARGSATIDTLLSPLLAGRLGNETCRAATGASREQLAAQVLSDLAAARIEIAHRLLAMLTPLLGLSDVDARDLEPTLPTLSLSGLGLDSLSAVRLRSRIQDEFGCDIPPHLLFGDATISDVVAKVVQQIILQAMITTKEPLPEADLEVLTI